MKKKEKKKKRDEEEENKNLERIEGHTAEKKEKIFLNTVYDGVRSFINYVISEKFLCF